MGKSFKNRLEDGKVRKTEQFTHLAKISQPCENFATLRKPIRTLCENFVGHAKKFANPKLPGEIPYET